MRNDLFVSGGNMDDTTQFRESSKSRSIFVKNLACFFYLSFSEFCWLFLFGTPIWYRYDMWSKCHDYILSSPWDSCVSTHQMSLYCLIEQRQLPYRTKIRRTKLSKLWLGVENFGRRNILSDRRKFCPTKFCPIR